MTLAVVVVRSVFRRNDKQCTVCVVDRLKLFMPQRLNDCLGMGVGRNGKSLVGIPWERELVTKLGMGMQKAIPGHL